MTRRPLLAAAPDRGAFFFLPPWRGFASTIYRCIISRRSRADAAAGLQLALRVHTRLEPPASKHARTHARTHTGRALYLLLLSLSRTHRDVQTTNCSSTAYTRISRARRAAVYYTYVYTYVARGSSPLSVSLARAPFAARARNGAAAAAELALHSTLNGDCKMADAADTGRERENGVVAACMYVLCGCESGGGGDDGGCECNCLMPLSLFFP